MKTKKQIFRVKTPRGLVQVTVARDVSGVVVYRLYHRV